MPPYLLKTDWGGQWSEVSTTVFPLCGNNWQYPFDSFTVVPDTIIILNLWGSNWYKCLVSFSLLSLTLSSYCYDITKAAGFFPMLETAEQCWSRNLNSHVIFQNHIDFPPGTCRISPAELWVFAGEESTCGSQEKMWLLSFLASCSVFGEVMRVAMEKHNTLGGLE